jgi:hypothetical protein
MHMRISETSWTAKWKEVDSNECLSMVKEVVGTVATTNEENEEDIM